LDESPGIPDPRGWGVREQRKPVSDEPEPQSQPAPLTSLLPVVPGAVLPPYRPAGAGAGFVPAVYAPPTSAPAPVGTGPAAPAWRVPSSSARRTGLRLAPVLGVVGGLGYLAVKLLLLHVLTGGGIVGISHPRALNLDDAGKCVVVDDANRMTGIVDCSQPHRGRIVNVVASGSECPTGPGIVAFVRSDLSGAAACVDIRQ
jgi:hypothetical protein